MLLKSEFHCSHSVPKMFKLIPRNMNRRARTFSKPNIEPLRKLQFIRGKVLEAAADRISCCCTFLREVKLPKGVPRKTQRENSWMQPILYGLLERYGSYRKAERTIARIHSHGVEPVLKPALDSTFLERQPLNAIDIHYEWWDREQIIY